MTSRFPFVHLASRSPRRRQLLQQLGVSHELLLPDDAEQAEALEAVRPAEAPAAYVQRVTGLKLAAAQQRLRERVPEKHAQAVLLCADTTVALADRILGKPQDAAQAERMLQALSGRTHEVLTAVTVAAGAERWAATSRTQVQFADLVAADVAYYVASQEWRGKAGGYAIQGLAAEFVAHISGSYSGVMGLPLHETAALLRQAAATVGQTA